jgi:Zn-dependent protease
MRVGGLLVGLGGLALELGSVQSLGLIVAAWFLFYGVARVLRLERYGVDLHPLYALVKSTRLNSFLLRVGGWRPGFWKVLGNMGVASFPGQVVFMTLLLVQNLYKFVYVPQQASPVMPLIPGVTIRFSSLPWFLAAAGVVILLHELAHGVQCVVEGVRVKSAALLLAVVTFGGAVEPEEEDMKSAALMSKLRIFAFGSFVNLVTGVALILFFYLWQGGLPSTLAVFLNWLYFISTNLALVNMLPVYPLDGGQMLRAWLTTREGLGPWAERAAMYGFLALMVSNLVLSLARFGLIPI